MNWETDTLIGRLEAGDMSGVKKDIMKIVEKKFQSKVQDRIEQFKSEFNGVTKED